MLQDWQLHFISLTVLFFFCFRLIKYDLFWMYLWQLKNYHIGRFLAHFETDNGKKIFYNIFFLMKFFFFLLFLSFMIFERMQGAGYDSLPEYIIMPIWLSLGMASVFIIGEGFLALISLLSGKFLKPEKTSKTLFLTLPVFLPLIVIAYLFFGSSFQGIIDRLPFGISEALLFLFSLLALDIFTPIISSFIILSLQPFTVAMRNKTLQKATFKIETLKDLLVIGVTGSYGKSSTKEFLRTILSESFKVVATPKNQNSEIGISECILRDVNDSHEIFICEMGAYNKGGIKMLCDIAQPKIGVLVAIGNQHLSTFGSQQNIIDGKFELIESLPKEGLAVLNWDNEYIRERFMGGIANMKCSFRKKEDVWAEGLEFSSEGAIFDACFKNGERIRIETGILGEYNILNLLLCIGVAKKIGMTKEEIANGCKRISLEVSGMGKKSTKHGFSVIDSSYSANKAGVLAHLAYFKGVEAEKKVLVMPCIIELGREGKQTHYEIGRRIAETCDQAIITSKDYFEDLKAGAVSNGMKPDDIVCIENPIECFKLLSNKSSSGIVLLEGRSSSVLLNKIFE